MPYSFTSKLVAHSWEAICPMRCCNLLATLLKLHNILRRVKQQFQLRGPVHLQVTVWFVCQWCLCFGVADSCLGVHIYCKHCMSYKTLPDPKAKCCIGKKQKNKKNQNLLFYKQTCYWSEHEWFYYNSNNSGDKDVFKLPPLYMQLWPVTQYNHILPSLLQTSSKSFSSVSGV